MSFYFICCSVLPSPYLCFIFFPLYQSAPVKKHMLSLSYNSPTHSLMLPLHNTTPTGLLSVPSLLPCNTQRQARELISGPDLAIRARLLSVNRTQSSVAIGLLTGHNTLRKCLYILGQIITPLVGNVVLRRKPQSTFYVSVRPWLHSYIHIGVPSFLDPEDIRKLSVGVNWNFVKGTGLL
jgi:hypothetical protein